MSENGKCKEMEMSENGICEYEKREHEMRGNGTCMESSTYVKSIHEYVNMRSVTMWEM